MINVVKIKYFAWIKERIGLSEEDLSLPENIATGHELIGYLCQKGENYQRAFSPIEAINLAADHQHMRLEDPIMGAKEIALFPPMTGG